jgi:hypothetical protein
LETWLKAITPVPRELRRAAIKDKLNGQGGKVIFPRNFLTQ